MKKVPIRSARVQSDRISGVILEVRIKSQGGPIQQFRLKNRRAASSFLRRNFEMLQIGAK